MPVLTDCSPALAVGRSPRFICPFVIDRRMFNLVTSVPLQAGGGFLYWAVIFFVLAIVAAAVGARGVAGISMEVARIFVLIFIILAIVSLLL